jgi:predicted ester cyclase
MSDPFKTDPGRGSDNGRMTRRKLFTLGLGLAIPACTARVPAKEGAQMTAIPLSETKAAARRFYDILNQALASGDLGSLGQVIAEDAVDHNPVPGMKQGLAGIAEAFGQGRGAFPDLQFTVEDMVAEGEKVACRITTRATHRGEFLGIQATGKQVTTTGIDILRMAGGKLAERWGEFDTLGLLQQLRD